MTPPDSPPVRVLAGPPRTAPHGVERGAVRGEPFARRVREDGRRRAAVIRKAGLAATP